MAEFPSIAPQSYEQDPNTVNRIGKRQILPGSIQARHLSENFITEAGIWVWNFSLLASQIGIMNLTFNTPNEDVMLPIIEMTVCQDVYDSGHQLRAGLSINMENWNLYGPYFNLMPSNGKGVSISTYVLNKDSVTHTVIAKLRLRYISVQSTGSGVAS